MPSISPDSLGKLSSAIRALEGKEIVGDRVNIHNNYRLNQAAEKARKLVESSERIEILFQSMPKHQRTRGTFNETIRKLQELEKEVNLLRDKLKSDKDADVKAALDQLSQSISEVKNSAIQARNESPADPTTAKTGGTAPPPVKTGQRAGSSEGDGNGDEFVEMGTFAPAPAPAAEAAAVSESENKSPADATTAKTGGTASAPVQTVQRTVASEDDGDELEVMATPAPAAASEEDTASVSAVAEPARPNSVFYEDRKGGLDSLPPRLPGSGGGADVLPPQAAGSSFNASASKPASTPAP